MTKYQSKALLAKCRKLADEHIVEVGWGHDYNEKLLMSGNFTHGPKIKDFK